MRNMCNKKIEVEINDNNSEEKYFLPVDFIKYPKYDAHVHYHAFDDIVVRLAKKANIHLIAINTNFDFLDLDTQVEISKILHQRHPQSFDFIGAFDASAFASKTFTDDAIAQIKNCMAAGARGIKIWKNIGMHLKNEAGQYLMVDDPVFDPIFTFLEKEKIPLLVHLGEPRNCWLPIERMSISRDKGYFSKNPDFHMYLHPEAPSYEQQIEARDHLLERYPKLIIVGAHLGSMEWNLEMVAKRLDRYPNFYVDISVQFEHIYNQTIKDRSLVIDFFKTYYNRILYARDYFVSQYSDRKCLKILSKCFPRAYMNLSYRRERHVIKNQWLFFATDKLIRTDRMKNIKHVKGLRLSKDMVNHIFYGNIRHIYFNK